MARTRTTKKPASPNKAQAEFEKYTRRRQAQAASTGPSARVVGPEVAAGTFPASGLTWAAPPGVGMVPVYVAGPPPGPGDAGGPGSAAGPGLTDSIGTTVRLGVDLLNAALFNTAKILGGFTGSYGYDAHDGRGHGCGCESCCEPSCCQPDCCGCECCNPGVGSCC
ncbi:hypothetical protein [Reyranella sp.]|uniref:hypothetical protein n=1 Tax=Reyranella sp. TaxID=1929291 RepID=UPI003BA91416